MLIINKTSEHIFAHKAYSLPQVNVSWGAHSNHTIVYHPSQEHPVPVLPMLGDMRLEPSVRLEPSTLRADSRRATIEPPGTGYIYLLLCTG